MVMHRIIRFDPTTPKLIEPRCACIGYFDGLHRGHQQLIKKTIEKANLNHMIPTLITFDPDPWITMGKSELVYHITPLKQRCELAFSMGITDVMILNFSKEVMNLSIDAFEALLKSNGIMALIVGYDFTYGQFGKGNAITLVENDRFDTTVVPPYTYGQTKISSTRIETALKSGDIETVNTLLGYPFFIEGEVVHGRHVGHQLGFPTANIKPSIDQLIPLNGVYATWFHVDDQMYPSMTNIGHNPTCNYVNGLSVEVNVFDFNQDIYGSTIRIQFVSRIRDEHKFENKQALMHQLHHDQLHIREVLNAHR